MDKFLPYLNLYKDHKKLFKTAVIIITMVAAVVVFALKGEIRNHHAVYSGADGQTLEISEVTGDEGQREEGEGNAGNAEDSASVYVDISGQVKNPGVYEVKEGSRLFEVIEKAGGLKQNADTVNINQAETVCDGQKIMIPQVSEDGQGSSYAEGGTAVYNPKVPTGDKTFTSDGRININTADKTGLQEIPGVGPVTADKIIAYREANGRFKTIEDVKNVSGIGEKIYEKIKDMLAV